MTIANKFHWKVILRNKDGETDSILIKGIRRQKEAEQSALNIYDRKGWQVFSSQLKMVAR